MSKIEEVRFGDKPWSWYAEREFDLQCSLDPLGDDGKNEALDKREKEWILSQWTPNWNDKVLDFACGIGRLSEWIASDVGSILAIDTCKEMIQRAKKNQRKGNITYKHTRLDLVKGKFNIILAVGVMKVFNEEQKKAVREEFNRLLVPGGKILEYDL